MPTDLVTMRCIKGEEWPAESFKSFVDTDSQTISEESVIFLCPKNHKFNLKEALSKDIFSRGQAQKIMAKAVELYADQRRRSKTHLPSDYLPNRGVVEKNIPCDGCGKKAQQPHHVMFLCLDCMAAFENYLEKYLEEEGVYSVMYDRWGKANDLLWRKIFNRYMESMSPLGKQEMEDLFRQCKKEVRKSYYAKLKVRDKKQDPIN